MDLISAALGVILALVWRQYSREKEQLTKDLKNTGSCDRKIVYCEGNNTMNISQAKGIARHTFYGGLMGVSISSCIVLVFLIAAFTAISANAHQQKTLQLSDEFETDNKRICFYEDAQRSETVEKKLSQQCAAVLVVASD